jgi:hypothetical protein
MADKEDRLTYGGLKTIPRMYGSAWCRGPMGWRRFRQ